MHAIMYLYNSHFSLENEQSLICPKSDRGNTTGGILARVKERHNKRAVCI